MDLHDSIGHTVPYYPIFVDLTGKAVLVVGAGKVGLRKVRGLVEAGARVTVVAPEAAAALEKLAVRWLRRRFRASDMNGKTLAFTAADDREVNRKVMAEAKRRGIPVNVADAPEECDFLVPSRVRSGNLQIAVSTGGRNPRVAKQLRQKLEKLLREQSDGSERPVE